MIEAIVTMPTPKFPKPEKKRKRSADQMLRRERKTINGVAIFFIIIHSARATVVCSLSAAVSTDINILEGASLQRASERSGRLRVDKFNIVVYYTASFPHFLCQLYGWEKIAISPINFNDEEVYLVREGIVINV